MWCSPPFAGIGSEGYVALKLQRKFAGTELKASYWRQACKYLADAEREATTPTLLDLMERRTA